MFGKNNENVPNHKTHSNDKKKRAKPEIPLGEMSLERLQQKAVSKIQNFRGRSTMNEAEIVNWKNDIDSIIYTIYQKEK